MQGQSFKLIKFKASYTYLSQNTKKWLQELARKVLQKEYLEKLRGARLAIQVVKKNSVVVSFYLFNIRDLHTQFHQNNCSPRQL